MTTPVCVLTARVPLVVGVMIFTVEGLRVPWSLASTSRSTGVWNGVVVASSFASGVTVILIVCFTTWPLWSLTV